MATMRVFSLPPDAPDPLMAMAAHLSLLAEQAAALPEADHELLSGPELTPMLLEADLLLRSAAKAFGALAERLEAEPSVRDEGSVARPVVDPSQLVGVAHLARFSLSARRAELERIRTRLSTSDDEALRWEAIQLAHGGAGEVIKAVTGLDLGLSVLLRRDRGQPYFERVALLAVETRRAFVALRRVVDAARPPAPAALQARLGEIAAALEQLARAPVYPWLRVADRRALRGLHARLRAHAASPDSLEGRRLFQEAINLSEIALAVNQRQELRALDQHLVDAAEDALARHGSATSLLSLLEGRDAGLDAAMAASDVTAIASHLTRVRAGLEVDETIQLRSRGALERVVQRLVA